MGTLFALCQICACKEGSCCLQQPWNRSLTYVRPNLRTACSERYDMVEYIQKVLYHWSTWTTYTNTVCKSVKNRRPIHTLSG